MKCHSCESPMIPYRSDIQRKYKEIELTIKDFPIMTCVACDEEVYGAGTLIKYITLAKEQYNNTGECIFIVK
jgi:YgiT-type zinc finger domain-containing protein